MISISLTSSVNKKRLSLWYSLKIQSYLPDMKPNSQNYHMLAHILSLMWRGKPIPAREDWSQPFGRNCRLYIHKRMKKDIRKHCSWKRILKIENEKRKERDKGKKKQVKRWHDRSDHRGSSKKDRDEAPQNTPYPQRPQRDDWPFVDVFNFLSLLYGKESLFQLWEARSKVKNYKCLLVVPQHHPRIRTFRGYKADYM